MNMQVCADLSKKTLIELKEILNRYETLLKNRKVLENLTDKGEAIITAREKLIEEIKLRESVQNLENTFSTLSVDNKGNCDVLKEKHVQHICQMDKPFEDSRYKPHKTLIQKNKDTKNEGSTLDSKSSAEEISKCIPLAESLIIQTEQFQKAKADHAKNFLSGFLKEDEIKESDLDVEKVTVDLENPDEIV